MLATIWRLKKRLTQKRKGKVAQRAKRDASPSRRHCSRRTSGVGQRCARAQRRGDARRPLPMKTGGARERCAQGDDVGLTDGERTAEAGVERGVEHDLALGGGGGVFEVGGAVAEAPARAPLLPGRRRGVEGGRCLFLVLGVFRGGGGGEGEGAHDELVEAALEVVAGGDDGVEGVGPDDEDAFVALRGATVSGCGAGRGRGLTMKAAHCSLSARGRRAMVSRTWMRVLGSTKRALAAGGLRARERGVWGDTGLTRRRGRRGRRRCGA